MGSNAGADSDNERLAARALDEHNGVVLRAADALGTRQKAYRMLSKRPDFELGSLRKKR